MKKALLAAACGLILAAALGLSGAWLNVTAYPIEGLAAAQQPSLYEQLSRAAEEGSLHGTVFAIAPLPMERARLVTYTVRVRNFLPVPVQMPELSLEPMAGDRLAVAGSVLLGDDINRPAPVAPFGESTLQLVLLTEEARDERDLALSGYVLGFAFTRPVR